MSNAKPRLFIIGSRGFLGGVMAQEAALEYEVIGGIRGGGPEAGEVQIDLKDEASVKAAFQAVQPDTVLLFSAISDIDRCERFPDEAWAVNLRGAEHVANACARGRVRLLFTSTAAPLR